MSLLKYAVALSFAFSLTSYANTSADLPYSVPFYHFSLPGKHSMQVVYDFDSCRQNVSCWEEGKNTLPSSVEWTYKSGSYINLLPISLMNNVHFKGHFADTEGKMTITNTNDDEPVLVSCEYRNVK